MEQTAAYNYFCNRSCEFFPCHRADGTDYFNCLFCYCPLYALGADCGGGFRYTDGGIKDCSACLLPHAKGGYDYIVRRSAELVRRMARPAGEK